ncbi:MAG: T9SS type A sorting domain-containing protein [Saprospiraceae bacterium]
MRFPLNVLDPQGTQINPDERNYMSYFLNCTDDEYFSPTSSIAAILSDWNSFQRNYLRLDHVPAIFAYHRRSSFPFTPLKVKIWIQRCQFQLDSVQMRTLTCSNIRASTFTINPIRRIVYGNSVVLDDLEANRTYYWRVRPFNAHFTCIPMSSTTSFTTGTTVATQAPSFVESFRVSPNPVPSNSQLSVELVTEQAFTASVQLLDVTGKAISTYPMQVGIGQQYLTIPTGELAKGVYLLRLVTEKGSITEKVVVN